MDGLSTILSENRLIAATPLDPASGLQKIELAYDFMSRRVRKVVSAYTGSAWNQEQERLCVYDGWNLLRETTTTDSGTSTEYYVWGLDLSGSLHGAGGVGGLLSKTNDQTSQTFQYLYDANGNVGQLLNAADGSLAAHYEYDPFGNLVFSTGSEAESNMFRFSTKYLDAEIGWYYYGHRYYDPVLGRWPTRDPIEELGFRLFREEEIDWAKVERGRNLYNYLKNSPISWLDLLGLASQKANCGPNVTPQLTEVIERVRTDYYENMPPEEQQSRCDAALTKNLSVTTAWDIAQFAPDDPENKFRFYEGAYYPEYEGVCPTEECIGTIQVEGKCFAVADVNYVLFGVIGKGCITIWTRNNYSSFLA